MKICHEWDEIKYIEATCPYCHVIDTHCAGPCAEGDIVDCSNPKCKKRFKLGERE